MPHSTTDTTLTLLTPKPPLSPQSQSLTTFPLFSLLPPELRLQIYTHCLPSPRILELEFSPPSQTFVPVYFSYSSIPVLLHLVSESRSFALHHYYYIAPLNIWFSSRRDSLYFRIGASQIYSPYYSAWVEKIESMLGSVGDDEDENGYGLQRLKYLIIGEEAYSHLVTLPSILGSLHNLKEIGVVTKEEMLHIWPESEVSLLVDKRTRRKKEKEDRMEGPPIKYFHVRRRFKGVLMGSSDGSFIREEKRDPFAVGW